MVLNLHMFIDQRSWEIQMSPDKRAPEYKDGNRQTGELSATRARQGVTGHHVRYVLIFGIAAAVVAFIVAYLYI
jgi:hypothetical protein